MSECPKGTAPQFLHYYSNSSGQCMWCGKREEAAMRERPTYDELAEVILAVFDPAHKGEPPDESLTLAFDVADRLRQVDGNDE